MLFAILSGIVVFGEFPDWIAMLGMVLIVATGLYAAHREALSAKALSDSARTHSAVRQTAQIEDARRTRWCGMRIATLAVK